MSQSIQPLRIQKNTPTSSPNKMSLAPGQRPLAELGATEQRRNSPSYLQKSKMTTLGMEASPFDSSPFVSKSPRLYWQSRDPASPSRLNVENRSPTDQRDGSPSPSKRSSIENLKRASRVKNSNMFAREHRQEYDPSSSPNIERPLATGRPLSKQESEKVYGSRGINRLEKGASLESSKIPIYSPPKSPPKFCEVPEISQTPSKAQSSPSKSSLSSKTRYAQIPILDPENGTWSEDEDSTADRELPPGKSLHRHAKSVTFDAAPPQINEYEMTTPDPSSVASGSREGSYESAGNEEEDSFDRGSSIERDDSFDESLEDTEKTPVVLPEDWRFMSPATANDDLAAHIENPFNGSESSPAPTARPSSAIDARTSPSRTDSANSNGERRPLPPLPAFGMPEFLRERSNSAGSLSASAERMSLSYDKKEPNSGIQIYEDQVANDDVAGLDEFQKPPRISRESILRKVKSQRQLFNEDDYDFSSPTPDQLTEKDRIDQLHPDVPIPSLEVEPQVDYTEVDRIIKQEEDEESEIDVYSIPDLYSQQLHVEAYMDSMEDNQAFEDAPSHISRNQDEDDESHYSEDFEVERSLSKSPKDDEGPPTPKVNQSTDTGARTESGNERRTSLPQFSSMLEEQDFGLGLNSFMTPPPALNEDPVKATPPSPNTPDSVIRHAIAGSPLPESPSVPEPIATIKAPGTNLKTRPSITPADIRAMAETRRQVSGETLLVPKIPEQYQSRSSVVIEPEAFPTEHETFLKVDEGMSDFETSKQAKRKSSLVQLEIPVDRSDDELGLGLNKEFDRVMEAQKVAFKSLAPEPGLQSSSHGCAEFMAGQHFIPITQNFADKRIRTQKGYLMRQNTKVVVASSASQEDAVDPIDTNGTALRGTRSAGNSPRKSAHAQPWTTEPWNGKMRRKSLRQSGGSPQKKVFQGVAPPLPGQQSNVAGVLGSVTEDSVISGTEELEEDGEKGVLFVKVVRVKDLDLPLPKGERSYFALTLDNGLHCVTTAWLELGKTAPIGQEFELIVLNELEFQLTLQTKIEEPKLKPITESPTKSVRTPKPSTFSRVFASPKKRKELELKQQEEAQNAERQRQQEAQANRRATQPTAWDLLHGLVAKDGSFARSYVCLKDHESKAYGRPFTVDVPCFNEWATEDAQTLSSVKSKRSTTRGGVQRKAPYKIGKLELQLLFVPKPKGSKDEDMPKSMNACIRELKEAETAKPQKWEGHLSQQGGDCPYWRRRFFTLEGPKFTAHHEVTRQPRATIHLAGARKLIDDKSSLMQKETSGRGGGRRKSAFAEEEEGYMFVEEGFRIRFDNGETIDFYADSAAEKDGWMKALAEVVGKEPSKVKGWTDLVLAKQRSASSESSRSTNSTQTHKKAPPQKSAPATPASYTTQQTVMPPPPAERKPRHSATEYSRAGSAKTRSMIF